MFNENSNLQLAATAQREVTEQIRAGSSPRAEPRAETTQSPAYAAIDSHMWRGCREWITL